MERRLESPAFSMIFCGLVDPPGREAARFAGLVEEDDVAVRVAKPRLAPHPWLVARAMLEREPAPRELLNAIVEIVAFEIDCRRRDDLLFGIDLDGERRAASRLEPRIVRRIV